jgi:hypothetical protein
MFDEISLEHAQSFCGFALGNASATSVPPAAIRRQAYRSERSDRPTKAAANLIAKNVPTDRSRSARGMNETKVHAARVNVRE